jgi:SAM-dependent methyltransferase
MDTRYVALSGLDLSGCRGVEFGPLTSPMVKKAESTIYYADHCSTEELKAKYEPDPAVDTAAIVDVDLDLSRQSLQEVAPLDFVVASHVVEHVPDLIGWLEEVHAALRPGGVLALVIPDKRFTFDLHRREAPLWEIEAAYQERRKRPGLWCILDHFVNVVHADAAQLWDNPAAANDARPIPPRTVVEKVMRKWNEGLYQDTHCWVFTPWSFVRTIGWIVEKYGIGYRLRFFQPTARGHLEFYAQLQKLRPGEAPTNWREQAAEAERTAPKPTCSSGMSIGCTPA